MVPSESGERECVFAFVKILSRWISRGMEMRKGSVGGGDKFHAPHRAAGEKVGTRIFAGGIGFCTDERRDEVCIGQAYAVFQRTTNSQSPNTCLGFPTPA